ncbi:MAG: glycoside hydrolase family 113 [Anaerolineales bacterium]
MRIRRAIFRSAAVAVLAGWVLAGCGSNNPYPIPTPLPLAKYTISFLVRVPDDTTPGDKVILNILDEVTGLTLNPTSYEMKSVDTGLWQLNLDFPRNALVHYRYSLQSGAIEAGSGSGMVDYRTYFASGNNQAEDTVAHWLGTDFHGTTGRIRGLVRDAVTGLAAPGIVVGTAGMRTLTDTSGYYLLSGVPTGKQNLVAFDMNGNYRPFLQEAIVADGQDTPADLSLSPAPKVTVSFHLYVPQAEMPPGAQVRMAGNLLMLGNTFQPGAASTMIEPGRVPLMTMLNDGTYLLSLSMPVGTYVRYKFTMGDGFWNAERDSQGRMVMREMIVPEYDTIVENGVTTWRSSDQGPVTFNAIAPANTPASEKVYIQFSPFHGIWMRPIPMWMIAPQQWTFTLESPLEWPGEVSYRYCRNGMCSLADDVSTAGEESNGRLFQVTDQQQSPVDTITGWTVWPDTSAAVIPAPSAPVRSSLQFGVVLSSDRWAPPYDSAIADLISLRAETVFLSPQWYLGANAPVPEIRYLPELASPLRPDVVDQIAYLRAAGIRPALAPNLSALTGLTTDWWDTAPRDPSWWDAFFQTYANVLYTYADIAQQNGVEELVIARADMLPAMPGLPGTPADIETRWRVMARNVRLRYAGKLAVELPLTDAFPAIPQFFDEIDEVIVRVRGPLTAGSNSPEEMKAAAGTLLDEKLAGLQALGKTVFLAPAYASLEGADAGCPRDAMGGCLPVSSILPGTNLALTLTPDFDAQTRSYQALLSAAADRDWITGFFAWGYFAPVGLRDASPSIHGKPVEIFLASMFNRQ